MDEAILTPNPVVAEMIEVNGFVNDTLARGLEKRMMREQDDVREETLRRALQFNPPKNREKWRKAAVKILSDMAGEFLVGEARVGRHITIVMRMNETAHDGLYQLAGGRINAKKREVSTIYFRLGMTRHAVQRYFERVRVPFSFSAFAAVLGAGLLHEPRVPFNIFMPEGVFIFDVVEVNGDTLSIAKTFLGLKEMNAELQAEWAERCAP